jgi:rfaE bifunctional protein kinase chain/domain
LNRQQAAQLFPRFRSLKILVLGDFMLDQFIWGNVDRVSPEAPVPVVDVERESIALGGAGNVAKNAQALGANVIPCGVIGGDWGGESIQRLLTEINVGSDCLLCCDRATTLKTRIMAHKQQIVRIDREVRTFIADDLQASLVKHFLDHLDEVDGVIISDYSKGTVSPNLLKQILPVAKEKKKLVCLDPKIRYFSSYSPVTVVTPNQAEAGAVFGHPIVSQQDLEEAADRILNMIDCSALLITRGENGMALFFDGKMTIIPARAREVFDVTGAGDTVISVLCVALAAGANMIDAVKLTNAAAGIVVGKVGTASVTPEELLDVL